MRYVSWVSDNGYTLIFDGKAPADGGGPFFLRELQSDLGATAESAKAPRQDGITSYYAALDARVINLTGSMLVFGSHTSPALMEYDRQRACLCQALAPHRWGMLTYYKEDEAVRVRCRPTATPTISPPVGTYSTLDITFTADSPYWETADEYVVGMGMIQKFLHFPWIPVRGPLGAFNRFATIDNSTGELVYPTVEVYSTGQQITVTNLTSGEAMTIEHAVDEGQKLLIDMRDITAWLWERDETGDYIKKEDVSHWLSLDSVPWGLRPGRNRVAVTNDVPEDTPISYLRYRLPRLGV